MFFNPSGKLVVGSHFNNTLAFVMSGFLLLGSSLSRNDCLCITFDFVFVRLTIFSDRAFIVSSSGLPMFIGPVMLFAENSWNETYEQQADGSWVPFDFDKLRTHEGMALVAKYADGAGPSNDMVIDGAASKKGNIVITDFVKLAHDNKMVVHPYTVRKDKLPAYVDNVDELYEAILYQAGADGLFTDFPDLGLNFVKNHK